MKQATLKEGARGIQSIEVSGRILRALANSSKAMMLKDLASAATITPAQCHAYLTSLKNVGLVNQDVASGLYNIGHFAMRLAISWVNSSPLAKDVIHQITALATETDTMTMAVVWGNFGPTVIEVGAGSTSANMNLRPGSLLSITGSASGRVFAAFGNKEIVAPMIHSELSNHFSDRAIGTALTEQEFESRIETIRAYGYSLANSAPIPGINALSAPVFDADGELAMAITFIGSEDELAIAEDSPAISRLTRLAASLSHQKYL